MTAPRAFGDGGVYGTLYVEIRAKRETYARDLEEIASDSRAAAKTIETELGGSLGTVQSAAARAGAELARMTSTTREAGAGLGEVGAAATGAGTATKGLTESAEALNQAMANQQAATKARVADLWKIADGADLAGEAFEGLAKKMIAAVVQGNPAAYIEKLRNELLLLGQQAGATEKQLGGLNDIANVGLKNAGRSAVPLQEALGGVAGKAAVASQATSDAARAFIEAGRQGTDAFESVSRSVESTATSVGFFFGTKGIIAAAVISTVVAVVQAVRQAALEAQKAVEDAEKSAQRVIKSMTDPRLELQAQSALLGSQILQKTQLLEDVTAKLGENVDKKWAEELRKQIDTMTREKAALEGAAERLSVAQMDRQTRTLAGLKDLNAATAYETEALRGAQQRLNAEYVSLYGKVDAASSARRAEVIKLLQEINSAFTTEDPKKSTGASGKTPLEKATEQVAALQAQLVKMGEQSRDVGGTVDSAFGPILRTITQLRTEFPQLGPQLDDLEQRFLRIRGARLADAFQAAREQFAGMVAALTPSKVDDMQERIRAFVKFAEANKAALDPAQVKAYVAQLEDLRDVTELLERWDASLRDIQDNGSILPDGTNRELEATKAELAELLALREKMLDKSGGTETEATAVLRAKIAELEARIAKLTGETAKNAKDTTQHFADGYRVGQDMLNVLTSAVTATGLLSEESANVVRGFASAAAGALRIAEALKTAGSWSKLLSSGAGMLGLVSGVGGIVAGLSSVFGNTAESQETKRLQQESLATLKRIAENTADLRGRNITSTDLSYALGKANDALSRYEKNPRPTNLGVIIGTAANDTKLREIADALGVPFRKSIGFFEDLKKAIETIDYKAFTDTFSGWIESIELMERLGKGGDATTQLQNRLGAITKAGGELGKLVAGFDTSTAGGVSSALDQLFGFLDKLRSGEIKDFGGLTLDQTLKAIEDLIKRLQGLEPAAKTADEVLSNTLDIIDVKVRLLGLSAKDAFTQTLDALTKRYTALADLPPLDFSTAEAFNASLATFEEKARSIIDTLLADGELSDADRALIAVLESLIEQAKKAAPALADVAKVLGKFDEFQLRADVFGFNTGQRFKGAASSIFDGLDIPDSIKSLIEELQKGFDPTNAADFERWKKVGQAIFDELAKGGITDGENAIVQAILSLFGLGEKWFEESKKPKNTFSSGDVPTLVKLGIISANEGAKRTAEALSKSSPAFKEFFKGFDFSTLDTAAGLTAFNKKLKEFYAAISDGSIVLGEGDLAAEDMKGAIEEMIDAVLRAIDALTGVTVAVKSLGEQARDALSELDTNLALNQQSGDKAARAKGGLGAIVKAAQSAGVAVPAFGELTRESAPGIIGKLRDFANAHRDDPALVASIITVMNDIQAWLSELDAIDAKNASAASAAKTAQNDAAVRAVGTFATTSAGQADAMIRLMGRMVTATEAIQAMIARVGAGLTPPPLLSGAGGSGNLIVNFYGPVGSPQGVVDAIMQLIPYIDNGLGLSQKREGRVLGNNRTTV